MPATSPGGDGEEQERARKLAEFARSAERQLLEVLEKRKGDLDSNAPSVSSPGWIDAAAVARSRGAIAATRLMLESSEAWESSDEAVVRAVARLAVAASGKSDVDVAPLSSLAALPRALSALVASRERSVAGGSLPQLVEAVGACSAAIARHSSSSSSNPPLLENADAALLAAAAAAAAAPPPEALFASLGGDPLLSSTARGYVEQEEGEEEIDTAAVSAAAKEWRERAKACVSAAAAAVAAAVDAKSPRPQTHPQPPRAPSPPILKPPPPPASSLWDITGNSSRHSSTLMSASAVAAAGARNRGPLIEVIDDGESFDGYGVGDEEEKREETEDATAAAEAASEASSLEEAQAQALRLAALYSRDGELGCSWANSEDDDDKPLPSFPFLPRDEPLPRFTARLLPRALRPLHACLTSVEQQKGGIDSVKIKVFEGPGVFERACSAYALAALLRWIIDSPGSPGSVLGDISVALPALLSAADDPSPAVARLGLLSLARLAKALRRSGGGRPFDLARQHPAEASLLAAASRRAALGSDERAASAATAAASALAVALDGFNGDDDESEGTVSSRDKRPAECCSSIFSDLLDDAQRHAHEPARSALWLHSTRPVFERIGLGVAPALSGRVFPLLVRWMLLPPPSGSRKTRRLHLPREAALTLLVVTKRAWPRVGARVHALPLWSATALAFERVGKKKEKDDELFRASLVELGGAVRAAAVAVAAAGAAAASAEIDEALAGVDGGAELLRAVREGEGRERVTTRERL